MAKVVKEVRTKAGATQKVVSTLQKKTKEQSIKNLSNSLITKISALFGKASNLKQTIPEDMENDPTVQIAPIGKSWSHKKVYSVSLWITKENRVIIHVYIFGREDIPFEDLYIDNVTLAMAHKKFDAYLKKCSARLAKRITADMILKSAITQALK